jgi:hypothetical protein
MKMNINEVEHQRILQLHRQSYNRNGLLITEQSNKIYTWATDPEYQYKVVNGNWWAKGPKLPSWKDISGNALAVKTLDRRHPEARTSSSSTTKRTKISGTVPFKNTTEGNAFRAWVRSDRSRYDEVRKALTNAGLKNKGNKPPTLDKSGKHDNSFMKIAWKTVGNNYKNKDEGDSWLSTDIGTYPQDRKEGDFFRKWMKGEYPDWKDGDEPLDFKGPNLHKYKNATIAAAWKEHGEEFRNSGVMKKYKNVDELPLASSVINPDDFESVILSDTLKNDGVMFDPTKNQIVGACTQKGCAQYVSDQFKEVVPAAKAYVGNAWHAHRLNQGQSAFRGMNGATVNEIVKLFNKINKDPREESAEGDTRTLVQSLIPPQTNFKNLKLNDLVGLYNSGSHNFTKAFYEGLTGHRNMGSGNKAGEGPFLLNKNTGQSWKATDIESDDEFTAQGTSNLSKGNGPGLNTHVGYVGAIVDGDPIIFHNIDKKVWTTPLSKMGGKTSILWSRPSGASGKGINIKQDKGYWDKFVDYVWG